MTPSILDALELFIRSWPILPFSFAYLFLRIVIPQLLGRQLQTKDVDHFIVSSVLFFLAWLWLSLVNTFVPEPYLDEFFHVPQAQKYCEGKYNEWDDKITTPPGLYGLTMAFREIDQMAQFRDPDCSPSILRSFNAWAIVATGYFAILCRHLVEARLNDARSMTRLRTISYYSVHTGFNIALLPVLFFFSGLYYTDIASTLTVLIAYHNHLQRVAPRQPSVLNDVWTVLLGALALLMRQTNVFWVVIYMGGLEAVHAIKTLRPTGTDQPVATTLQAQLSFFAQRYAVGDVHDAPLNLAWPDDLLWTAMSLGIAAVYNPLRILKQVWPHLSILGLFVGFVIWNGGVVLGDKSNHIATIHLTQMLYIWPFLAFFSAPLLLPYLLTPLRMVHVILSSRDAGITVSAQALGTPRDESSKKRDPDTHQQKDTASIQPDEKSTILRLAIWLFNSRIYYAPLVFGANILSLLVVKFNTLIHPFTLADNRHYMFYVFRYTIRRAEWVRFALVGAYSVCRWLVWDTLTGCSEGLGARWTPECSGFYHQGRDAPYINHPFWTPSPTRRRQTYAPKLPANASVPLQGEEGIQQAWLDDPTTTAAEPVSSSTAILLFLATTLSLVTAPLVEPRYFILPWVFWRLLVPAWRTHEHAGARKEAAHLERLPGVAALFRAGKKHDVRLVLETGWFVAINLATMYIFLAKPYRWRAEDGSVLDGGRLQRFMW